MAIKRNLASSAFIGLCLLSGLALVATSLIGKSPAEQKISKDKEALVKELGTGGAVDPKSASQKLTDSIKSANEEKERKEQKSREEAERMGREKAAMDKAAGVKPNTSQTPTASPSGAAAGAQGYPAGTPNLGAGNPQNLSSDEQARLVRDIEAATQLNALRSAKMVAYEEGSGSSGSSGARSVRMSGLPSAEELIRMGEAATSEKGSGSAAASQNIDNMKEKLLARSLADNNEKTPIEQPSTVQQRNAAFLKETGASANKNERDKATAGSFPRAPLSKYLLTEGWTIPAVLTRGINSDLAGDVSAMVTQKIYDSASGTMCLIPPGSQLRGKYNSEIVAGQQRLLFAFTGLYYANGTYVPLGSMNGSDPTGASGMAGDVDNHFWTIFGSSMAIAAVSTVASVVSARSSGSNVAVNVGGSISSNSTNVLSDVTKKMLDRNTSIKPTIRLGMGEKFTISITHDLVLPPLVTNPNCI